MRVPLEELAVLCFSIGVHRPRIGFSKILTRQWPPLRLLAAFAGRSGRRLPDPPGGWPGLYDLTLERYTVWRVEAKSLGALPGRLRNQRAVVPREFGLP